jgi:hypothetical protein
MALTKKQAREAREGWIAWAQDYGFDKFYYAFIANAQGAESTCVHCGQLIYLDIREGGGVTDWGAAYSDGGLDYGCPDSPETSEEGTGSHFPRRLITF